MPRYEYVLLDVFTDRAFGGNQLAVFLQAEGLSSAQMQAIATELNLAETTFVLPPQDPHNDFWVRIFSRIQEMPMAGHPTVGTAFVLALQNRVDTSQAEVTVKFEEKVGLVPVKIRLSEGLPVFCQMQQPLPQFGPTFEDRATVAAMLSLQLADLDEQLPVEVVSCGVPYLIVPVKSLRAMQSLKLRPEILQSIQPQIKNANVYAFTRQAETAQAQTHSRMLWCENGISDEDAATGSASGPLGSYLVRHRVFGEASRQQFLNEQGFEMRRPSFIQIEIESDERSITAVRVGGQAYYMGKGFLEIR